ncbi:stromal interaction molecule homolog isoform X2 [Toxorhynchites rutilus septentrionalis]|uniref:stromal interaction molecule homolog isoform X2 n=1 Tax=Toxorhynchites rutilus septentrionalis TaxID=329112 RepID=UPI00247A3A4B|nr:stromal interaction molecule homolog isoform X2 [Toxorhynchites rutilus septentrionalis]
MYIQRDEAGKRNKKKSWKKEPMKVWMNTVYRSLMQRDMKAMHCFRTTTVLFSSGRGRFPVPLLILLALSIAFVSSLASEVQSDDIQPNTRPVYSAQQQQQQQHKAPTHHHNDRGGSRGDPVGSTPLSSSGSNAQSDGSPPKLSSSSTSSQTGSTVSSSQQQQPSPPSHPSSRMLETRNSYAVLSQAMSQAVHHEFGTYGSGSADGACSLDDLDCIAHHDHLGMEAIRSLHRQLDDDDNGDIDLSESDDFLREELKYDSGYEKRHKAFHFNDDMHISVKELWEAWLRSEVHNWTVDQTTEWLAQSVQLPQYVHLFRQHKVTGKVLPRLAVNNMHYVSNVLGIKDPIHKQKIALKAMDAVLFGPPRETGTRWKDLLLVTLLLTAIIGSWYAYQQNKNAKIHLKRMAKDVEGLLKAEVALKDMQKELERARLEQENVGKEKMDLERRLREAPSLTSSNSDLELQQLKQEIEMLRSELSRAEVEINDHCWTPPQGLQNWLQLTYELENKQHIRKRIVAEKQLMSAREACEKLKKKRSSLVGAFVSTHGKSIDDVDRSIVEARNALNDVTNELQERMFRWRQIEQLLGFSIANNNGLPYLENLLYNRNGGGSKSYRSSRLSSSQDDLDDDSVQGLYDGICRGGRDDSSASDDGERGAERDTVTFIVGGYPCGTNLQMATLNTLNTGIVTPATASAYMALPQYHLGSNSLNNSSSVTSTTPSTPLSSPVLYGIGGGSNSPSPPLQQNMNDSSQSLQDETLISSSNERIVPPRSKKAPAKLPQIGPSSIGKAPMPPPRKTMSSQSLYSMVRSASSDLVSLESPTLSLPPPVTGTAPGVQLQRLFDGSYLPQHYHHQQQQHQQQQQQQQSAKQLPSQSAQPTSGDGSVTSSGIELGGGGAAAGQSAASAGPELDTYSTDSSSFDGGDVKRRRRRLHFPFGKKFSKTKKTQ